MKRILFISWLTMMCFLLLGNAYCWNVPTYLRVDAGARIWFSSIEGDLIQSDRTKLGLTDNLGLQPEQLVWEFLGSARFDNIHVVRLKAETTTVYDQASTGSSLKTRNFEIGYDLDFYMTPQMLFGSNSKISVVKLDTQVRDVTVGAVIYNYSENKTRALPSMGMHGTFYPVIEGVSLRPSISGRVDWWNHDNLEVWDWEVKTGVDIPINALWTWSVHGGYQFRHLKLKRDLDTVDMNRTGFFLETSLLF